jgi:hypothetical protein
MLKKTDARRVGKSRPSCQPHLAEGVVTSEDEVPMTTYVSVPTEVVIVASVPSDGALLVALVTISPAELVMYSIVPEVDVPLITVSVTEAEAPSSAMEDVFFRVSKNQCQSDVNLMGSRRRKKGWKENLRHPCIWYAWRLRYGSQGRRLYRARRRRKTTRPTWRWRKLE